MTDYAHTAHAAKDRYGKAQELAEWCWANGATPEHLMALTPGEWLALARRATGKTASHESQHLAYCLLEVKTAWAAANPTHPKARRTVRSLDDIVRDVTTRRTRT